MKLCNDFLFLISISNLYDESTSQRKIEQMERRHQAVSQGYRSEIEEYLGLLMNVEKELYVINSYFIFNFRQKL